jgi:hypothetical protein
VNDEVVRKGAWAARLGRHAGGTERVRPGALSLHSGSGTYDEQAAHQKMSQDRSEERRQRNAMQAARNTGQAQAKLTIEQCGEMLRILAGKRKRTASMTPGALQDLDLFDVNYKARCKS